MSLHQTPTASHRQSHAFSRAVTLPAGGIAILAVGGLLGNFTGLRVLASISPQYIPMAPTTAVCFLVFCAALHALARRPSGFAKLSVAVSVPLATLYCLLELAEPLVGRDLNFDGVAVPSIIPAGELPVGVMSPVTALTFCIAGAATLLLLAAGAGTRSRRVAGNAGSLLATVTAAIGAIVLLAYFYGTPFMYGGGSVPVAATTALGFLLLGVALVGASDPDSFPTCLVAGDTTSALLSRSFLPLMIIAVLAESLLSRFVASLPFLNEALIMALVVVLFGIVTALVVNRVARLTGSNIDRVSGDLRQAMKRLQESEEHHRTLLRTAMDGIWLIDGSGRILEVNDAYCRLSGYGEDELLRLTVADLEAMENAVEIAEHSRKIMAQGEDRFESRHRRKDGSLFDVEVSAQFRPGRKGQVFCFIRDITERKLGEQELKESRKQYHDLVEGTPDLITRVDLEGRLLFVNNAALGIFGLPLEQCLGRRAFDFIHPEDREDTMAAFQQWLAGSGEICLHENRQMGVDGRVHHMAWTIRREYDQQGRVCGFASTAKDITSRKRAEEERGALEAQLQQAQKLESVGSLAGGVAHDFNNMLSVIIGHASLALRLLDAANPLHTHLVEIERAAGRSADLTRQLLAFARKQTIAPKELDLNVTVGSMLNMLQRLIGEEVGLTWQPGADLWQVLMDPSQLDQILANLCVNARDAIGGVGKITIETGNRTVDERYSAQHAEVASGQYVRLAVSDDGCGMDQETVSRIFEPFFTTKEVGKGTGLGLSTVFGIVKQNRGFVNVYSEPGLGTTFTIHFPRHQGKQEALPVESAAAPISVGNETVLLVEDESAILKMVELMLRGRGYRVLAAHGPTDALRLAEAYGEDLDLLLTDVVMPEMNGKELASRLSSRSARFKCLFMSGYTADAIAKHGVLDDGVNFIEKPFNLNDLALKVREVLDQGA